MLFKIEIEGLSNLINYILHPLRDICWSSKHYNKELKIPNANTHLFTLATARITGTCNERY